MGGGPEVKKPRVKITQHIGHILNRKGITSKEKAGRRKKRVGATPTEKGPIFNKLKIEKY